MSIVLTEKTADDLNPFLVLGVNKHLIDRFSNDEELRKFIKGVYLAQIKQIHPDAHSGCIEKEKALKMINKAWEKIEKAPTLSLFRINQDDNQDFGSSFAKQLVAQEDSKEIARLRTEISSLKKEVSRQKEELIGEGYEKLKLLEKSVITNHRAITQENKSRSSFSPHSLANKFLMEVEVTHTIKSSAGPIIATKMKALVNINKDLLATKDEVFQETTPHLRKRQQNYTVPLSGSNDNGDTYLIGSIDQKYLKATDCYLSKDEMRPLLPFLKNKIEKGRCLVCITNRNLPTYYVSGKVLGFIKI